MLTPGLAAQDGKFFEKSWALSLGPTGGVLIGVGPFEVMVETQLRFMGGLSDVDWLVEEGLRDINTESSRWSFPLLLWRAHPVLSDARSRPLSPGCIVGDREDSGPTPGEVRGESRSGQIHRGFRRPAVCAPTAGAVPVNHTQGGRNTGSIESSYLGVILLILLPCMPRPAISPFCPKTQA